MSIIIEAAVLGSVASALVSVVSAYIAKRKSKSSDERKMKERKHLDEVEAELHKALMEIRNQSGPQSNELKEQLQKLFSEIKQTESVAGIEHNKSDKKDAV